MNLLEPIHKPQESLSFLPALTTKQVGDKLFPFSFCPSRRLSLSVLQCGHMGQKKAMNGEPLQKLLRMLHLWVVVLIINIELLYTPYWPHDDDNSYHLLSTYIILKWCPKNCPLVISFKLQNNPLRRVATNTPILQIRKLITESSVTSPKITQFVCGKNQVLTKIKYPYNGCLVVCDEFQPLEKML